MNETNLPYPMVYALAHPPHHESDKTTSTLAWWVLILRAVWRDGDPDKLTPAQWTDLGKAVVNAYQADQTRAALLREICATVDAFVAESAPKETP